MRQERFALASHHLPRSYRMRTSAGSGTEFEHTTDAAPAAVIPHQYVVKRTTDPSLLCGRKSDEDVRERLYEAPTPTTIRMRSMIFTVSRSLPQQADLGSIRPRPATTGASCRERGQTLGAERSWRQCACRRCRDTGMDINHRNSPVRWR